jgi:hypothetical protein
LHRGRGPRTRLRQRSSRHWCYEHVSCGAAGSGRATGGDHTLPPGTKIAIALAPATPDAKATAVYSFAVGDQTNPLAPRRVLLVGRGDRPTFVNTSVNVLNGFD